MSNNESNFLIHHDVYPPNSPMWLMVHDALDLPANYVNPPTFYAGIIRGGALRSIFNHFSMYFLLAGHYRQDGTWWNLFGEQPMPSAIQLIARVHYHEEPPTQETTDLLMALNRPNDIFIEEIRMGYTPTVLMGIVGLENVPVDNRFDAVRRILPGIGLFHPDTLDMAQKITHGGARYIKIADWSVAQREKLGTEHENLKDTFKKIRKDCKKLYAENKNTWRDHIEIDYPILKDYPDILEKMERVYFGDTADINASGTRLDPYEIRWEIAARRASPDYEPFSTTAETLSKHAIKPKSE